MRTAPSMVTSWLLAVLVALAAAQEMPRRMATVDEVQPDQRDAVHAVWVNGPTFSEKVGGGWPAFGSGAGRSDAECSTFDDSYTGYNDNGQYCEPASPALDDAAHLLLHSGRVGVVLDAGGLKVPDINSRELLPKLGVLSGVATTPREVYDELALSTSSIRLETTCGGVVDTYVLGQTDNTFVQVGLVRQGHAVTQVSITSLEFQKGPVVCDDTYQPQPEAGSQCTMDYVDGSTTNACNSAEYPICLGFVAGSAWGTCNTACVPTPPGQGGGPYGPCETFEGEGQPCGSDGLPGCTDQGGPRCNGFSNWPCNNPDYPDCVGFVQGSSWGVCTSVCTAVGAHPNLWAELSIWGDSLAFELAWDEGFSMGDECTGAITMDIGTHSRAVTVGSQSGADRLSLMLVDMEMDTLVEAPESTNPLQIASEGTVVTRPLTQDVFIEVPSNVPTCGYNLACTHTPLTLVDMVVINPHPADYQTLRLSFSRNFETRQGTSGRTGAEITGLTTQLWDTSTLQPTGIPIHISKNWHQGSAAAYWAGFDGYWWTANSLLRIPPNSTIALSLALNYERYGGTAAFSHAQLSIVGYSDKWLWEQAALGSGGENICFDPLGSHTRAFITDMRPKLFDGSWKENVGGGDFAQLFGADGKLLYIKEMDPVMHANGPCLSDAQYDGITIDGSVSTHTRIRGGRTDDMVRVFVDVRLEVLQDVSFSRLFFFQIGSETYSYNSLFGRFVWGSTGVDTTTMERTCAAAGGQMLHSTNLYSDDRPLRQAMDGAAPWWFAFEDNAAAGLESTDMVVGDRGLVIRRFAAQLGGVEQTSPSFSVMCDKIELGTPTGLSVLQAGDYVDMSLEILVLPRSGDEYDRALANTGSRTLTELAGMTTSQRVQAQAVGGELVVTAVKGARVEAHYPIHVVAEAGANAMFEVDGQALGFVPVVVSGLVTHHVPAGHGLWLRPEGANDFTLLAQGSGNEFWQTNFDRESGTYELVYNVEFVDTSTTVAFGSHPASWTDDGDDDDDDDDGDGDVSSCASIAAIPMRVMALAGFNVVDDDLVCTTE